MKEREREREEEVKVEMWEFILYLCCNKGGENRR